MKDELDKTSEDLARYIDINIQNINNAIYTIDALIENDIYEITHKYFNSIDKETIEIKNKFFDKLKQLKLASYKRYKDKLIRIKKVLEGSIY